MMETTVPWDREIQARLNEAEVYDSMGLFEESLQVYTDLISENRQLEPDQHNRILHRISLLKRRIQELETEAPAGIPSQELSILQGTHPAEDGFDDAMESGRALGELGLWKEAEQEFEKAFLQKPADPEVLKSFLGSLLAQMTPDQAAIRVTAAVEQSVMPASIQGEALAAAAIEFARRDQKDPAMKLFYAASAKDPDNPELADRLHAWMAEWMPGSRYDYLLSRNLVTSGQLQHALAQSQKLRKSVEHILMEEFHIAKSDIGKSLSLYYGCGFRAFDPKMELPVELVRSLKKSFLLHDVWVPISWGKNGIEIIVDDPRDIRKTDHIRALIKSRNITIYVGIREDIEQYIHHLFMSRASSPGEESIDLESLIPDVTFDEDREPEETLESLDENASQIVRLVDQILVTAYRNGVSDIHIEPSAITRQTGIRFRMDGVCQEYLKVPNTMARGILSRIKIMANLDISERRLPQDGKISFRRKNITPFELRVATMPTAGGHEDAVLRILAKAGAMPLDKMRLSSRNLEILKGILVQPYGLILVVGPTGSGKTTTLHAALGYINKPGIKIWTAEDPIEITQPGLRQVEVRPRIGLNFARVMRSFLRSDPDVIMIGEMRDEETASIGIEASLTGHLVFSTLHTNSAPETVTRLLDMGMNPLNFSDAFLGVLAQRLVRTLCAKCRQPYPPTQEELDDMAAAYGGADLLQASGIEWSSDLNLYRPVGCDACSGSGYKGRMGIHELMEGTPAIKRLIKKQGTTEDLFLQASREGMTTLKQDAIQKVFMGLTDIQEVRRVCIG